MITIKLAPKPVSDPRGPSEETRFQGYVKLEDLKALVQLDRENVLRNLGEELLKALSKAVERRPVELKTLTHPNG